MMDKIFSGENSRELWNIINEVTNPEAKDAIYKMGCMLQEFESYIEILETRITSLENRSATISGACC